MRHRSYLELHAPATIAPDDDTQQFLDAADSGRFPSSPPLSLAIGVDHGVSPGAKPALYLATEPEPIPLEEYAYRALEADDRWFTMKDKKGEWADSGFMWIRLMKDHPNLRDVEDPWGATRIIEAAVGMPLSIFGGGENSYARRQGQAGSDLGELLLAIWDEVQPALLAPCEGGFMEQANALRLAQPVCSDRRPDGGDPYHALLGLCYWLSKLKDGEAFDLSQERAGELIGRSKMTVNKLIKVAVKEGHLEQDKETGPQDSREAYLRRRCYRWRWLTPLATLGTPKETLPTDTHRILPTPTRSTWKGEEETRRRRGLAAAKERSNNGGRKNTQKKIRSLENFLDLLEGVTGGPTQYSARCPCHKGSRPNLSVKMGGNGGIVLNCHRGCEVRDVVEAMGLEMRDLFLQDGPKIHQ
jgi:hypothetical protein